MTHLAHHHHEDSMESRARDGIARVWEVQTEQGPRFASFEALRWAAEKLLYVLFVWPDEGEFSADGERFTFNDAHAGEYEPLMVDPQTANMLVKVHAAAQTEKTRQTIEEWTAKGRGEFGAIVETGWKCVRPSAPF